MNAWNCCNRRSGKTNPLHIAFCGNLYNFAGIREESLPVTAQIEERLLTALCPQLFCLLLDMFL